MAQLVALGARGGRSVRLTVELAYYAPERWQLRVALYRLALGEAEEDAVVLLPRYAKETVHDSMARPDGTRERHVWPHGLLLRAPLKAKELITEGPARTRASLRLQLRKAQVESLSKRAVAEARARPAKPQARRPFRSVLGV